MKSHKRMRIPTKVTLPYGFVIKVKELSDKQMSDNDMDDCMAAWVVEDRTVYLRGSMKHSEKVVTLAHELLHATHDWNLWTMREAGRLR